MRDRSTNPASRLAPSPTGALHLGNACTFLINWAMARRAGWRLIMRIEDLDGPRVKPGAVEQTLAILAWLGLDWDGEPIVQSADLGPYRAAMRKLAERGDVFACALTRKEIEAAASAPHGDEHELCFTPDLRPSDENVWRFDNEAINYRLRVERGEVVIHDTLRGESSFDVARTVGDFVVWTKRAQPSYQLAVVVDDARQGVTDVVRGADLLPSAARQKLLYEALGLPEPTWRHTPLIVGPDGRRLAKRHGDTRLATYREQGAPAERIIGVIARWLGVTEERAAMTAEDFRRRFDPATLPLGPITFTDEDDAWIRQRS